MVINEMYIRSGFTTFCLKNVVTHYTLDNAFDFVKQCKHNISPNFSFVGQLTKLASNPRLLALAQWSLATVAVRVARYMDIVSYLLG